MNIDKFVIHLVIEMSIIFGLVLIGLFFYSCSNKYLKKFFKLKPYKQNLFKVLLGMIFSIILIGFFWLNTKVDYLKTPIITITSILLLFILSLYFGILFLTSSLLIVITNLIICFYCTNYIELDNVNFFILIASLLFLYIIFFICNYFNSKKTLFVLSLIWCIVFDISYSFTDKYFDLQLVNYTINIVYIWLIFLFINKFISLYETYRKINKKHLYYAFKILNENGAYEKIFNTKNNAVARQGLLINFCFEQNDYLLKIIDNYNILKLYDLIFINIKKFLPETYRYVIYYSKNKHPCCFIDYNKNISIDSFLKSDNLEFIKQIIDSVPNKLIYKNYNIQLKLLVNIGLFGISSVDFFELNKICDDINMNKNELVKWVNIYKREVYKKKTFNFNTELTNGLEFKYNQVKSLNSSNRYIISCPVNFKLFIFNNNNLKTYIDKNQNKDDLKRLVSNFALKNFSYKKKYQGLHDKYKLLIDYPVNALLVQDFNFNHLISNIKSNGFELSNIILMLDLDELNKNNTKYEILIEKISLAKTYGIYFGFKNLSYLFLNNLINLNPQLVSLKLLNSKNKNATNYNNKLIMLVNKKNIDILSI